MGAINVFIPSVKYGDTFPTSVAALLYKSLLMSKINYGNVLCLGAPKVSLRRLQKLQHRALRVRHCADRYTSNNELNLISGFLPLALRRKLDLLKIMYFRMLNTSGGVTSTDRVTDVDSVPVPSLTRPSTRYSNARPPVFERPNTSRFIQSVTYQRPKLWADLPADLKNLNDISTFDREIRKLIRTELLSGDRV